MTNKRRSKTIVIGLTGSIGMGKSTALKMFGACGFSTLSADAIVHDLCKAKGAATRKILKHFPNVEGKDGVDRKALAREVLGNNDAIKTLESILHPLVFKACKAFVTEQRNKRALAVVLEIPLLFETGYHRQCDITVCVSATRAIQKERVLKRKHMTPKALRALLQKQMPDREKRSLADFVIKSDKGMANMRAQIKTLCDGLTEMQRRQHA